jgi:glyoxylase-like metal-dependent hydrolase (beta-lactamase superfamily II)
MPELKVTAFVCGPLENNVYVVAEPESRECIVVDPGIESEPAADFIERERLQLKFIVNTHGHFDHALGNAHFAKRFGAPVLIHRADLFLLRTMKPSALMFGFTAHSSPKPGGWLTDGADLTLGTEGIRIMHTPGHTPGGCCLLFGRTVVVGDVLFQGSVGRTDLPGGDFDALARSIREKLYALPDDTLVLPGHGPATTIGDERRGNPFVPGG